MSLGTDPDDTPVFQYTNIRGNEGLTVILLELIAHIQLKESRLGGLGCY